MKIKPEHYIQIKNKIGELAPKIAAHRDALKNDPRVKDLEKRVRWDLLHVALGSRWICDELYSYLNDDHIDTAIRSILREIESKNK